MPRYLPDHNAGAEATLHAILRWLVEEGWDATVASTEHRGAPYTWDGVNVVGAPRDADLGMLWEWCDVGVTHLHGTRSAMGWARRGRPLVHLVHNHTQLARERVPIGGAQLVVWNSDWIAADWMGRDVWPSLVLHPPVDVDRYATINPDRSLCGAVTLLNLTEVKGGLTFWRLCAERPDLPFLGVEGAYYLQEIPERLPANATVIENQVDVGLVYQQTRVLLVPSAYESYGRVAVEAMASGIPVIASDLPGLHEACGDAAIYCPPDDPQAWSAALKMLDSPAVYAQASSDAYQRAREVADRTAVEMERFVDAVLALAEGRSLAGLVKASS